VSGVGGLVVEVLADELVARDAVEDLGDKVLTCAVFEHVLATCVAHSARTGGVFGSRKQAVVVVDVGHCSVGGGSCNDEGGHSHCDSEEGVEESHIDFLGLVVRVWGERRNERRQERGEYYILVPSCAFAGGRSGGDTSSSSSESVSCYCIVVNDTKSIFAALCFSNPKWDPANWL
jgi:hypothetical protein